MTEQDEEEEEDDDDSDEESGEEGSSSEEEEEEETPGGMRSVSMSSLNVYPWRSTAAQPTNALARRMLEERGYTPPALPPPGLSSEPNQITFERNSSAPSIAQRPPTTPALGGRLREAAERTMPPRGKSTQQFGFGSSVPRRITSSSILRSTSPINRKLAASNTSSAASLLPPPPPDQPPVATSHLRRVVVKAALGAVGAAVDAARRVRAHQGRFCERGHPRAQRPP